MRIDVHKELSKIDLNKKIGANLDEEYLALQESWPVQKSIDYLRSHSLPVNIRYFPVVDKNNKLVGITSSHNLLMCAPEMRVSEMMVTDPISVHVDDIIKDVIILLKRHKLVSLPVVDDENILKGVIEMQVSSESFYGKSSNSLQIKKSLYSDIFQLIGISIEESESKGVFRGYCLRMPWLLGNLFAGFACAAIAGYFQLVLQKAIILAMFIPLVLTLSESISMQAMTMSLNFLHRSRVNWKDVLFRVIKELKTAILLGLSAGFAVEFIAYLLHSHDLPLFVVALSIFCSMSLSATVGVIIPVLVHRFNLDPKIAAGPVALMFADIFATALYLGLATWWIM